MKRLISAFSAAICVLAFCPVWAWTQPVQDDLHRAFKAVFGQDEATTLTLPDVYVRFTPERLIKTPSGYALISSGKPVSGPYRDVPGFDAYASHAASPKVAIHYLVVRNAKFVVTNTFVPATEIGMNGDGGPYIQTGAPLDGYPTIYIEGSSMSGGYGCTRLKAIELRPEGLAITADFTSRIDNIGAGRQDRLKSHIAHVIRGKSFDVVYSGNRHFTDHYVRIRDHYVLKGKSQMPTCA